MNIKDYYLSINQDPFDVLPLTYVISDGLNDPEFELFNDKYNQIKDQAVLENVWILKPGESSNRGTGI